MQSLKEEGNIFWTKPVINVHFMRVRPTLQCSCFIQCITIHMVLAKTLAQLMVLKEKLCLLSGGYQGGPGPYPPNPGPYPPGPPPQGYYQQPYQPQYQQQPPYG